MKTIDDLVVLPELEDAIRRHTPSERASLRAEILRDQSIHDPILWAWLAGGVEALVDGHGRLSIYEELVAEGEDIPQPRLEELACLRGASVEDAVEWIRRHQAARRNDESLAALYAVGKEFRESDKTSKEVAEEHGMTPQQVRHAAALADSVDAAEQILEGTREAVLASDMTPSAVRNAEPEDLVRSATSGAPKPKGPLDGFQPLTKAVAQLQAARKAGDRAVNSLENERTPCEYSEHATTLLEQLAVVVNDLEAWMKKWIASAA